MSAPVTLYDVLGLSQQCTLKEMEKSRRNCLYYLHSDKNKTETEDVLQDKRMIVQTAYDVLACDDKRNKYDDMLRKKVDSATFKGKKITHVAVKNIETAIETYSTDDEKQKRMMNLSCAILATIICMNKFSEARATVRKCHKTNKQK